MNNERGSETVGILAMGVGVIPVCAGLIYLSQYEHNVPFCKMNNNWPLP